MSPGAQDHDVVFLGGSIQYTIGANGTFSGPLEAAIRSLLKELKQHFNVLSVHEVEHFGDVDVERQPAMIMKRDLTWM